MIPYGRQSVSEEDISAVVRVLLSDFLTSGPEVEEFERQFAREMGAKHAVAVNSATAALHLAMRVLGIRSGDRVVTSPNTFLASANAAAYVGATPDFCDIDPQTYNIDPKRLSAEWQADTKGVVAVAYAGQSCDMPSISDVARRNGAYVIEDGCHGVGGGFFREGKPWKIGGHPWADITVFSFHPVKTMTTGEGGMLVTDNSEWAERARCLRSHGVERREFVGLGGGVDNAVLTEQGPWYYEMQELGYNYRLTEIQSALGISQLNRLPSFVNRRREIVGRYNEAFAGIDWMITPKTGLPEDASFISWHLYTTQIDFRRIGLSRTEVMRILREKGVGSQVLYIPVHLQPWYRKSFGYCVGKCPVAEAFYAKALSLPLYPAMRDGDVEKVIQAVRELSV